MDKEMDFYIYLIEKYAEYKNISAADIVNTLDKLDLTDLVYNMYERYHSESIQNAFADIDELIKERESK